MAKKYKKIGLFTLITLVCGNMIGSGVFLLPSSLAMIGTISLFSWLITGFGAICLALMFAHISHLIPVAGGPYGYNYRVLGSYIGFQTAYDYWFAIWIGNAAIAVAFVGYLGIFFPILKNSWYTFFASAGIIWFITLVNISGVGIAGLIQRLSTVFKLIPILLIGVLGWFYVDGTNFTNYAHISNNHLTTFSALSKGAALTFWAFIGLESATVPAGSVRNPQRNIPLATIIGTSITCIVYMLSSTAIMGIIPSPQLQHSTSPFADAAKIIFGVWGQDLVAVGAIVSCFGALNGWILLQAQVPMAAAQDGLFPKIFAKQNRYHTPVKGLIVTSILITALLLLTITDNLIKQFNTIILLAVISNVIPYFYTSISDMLCIKECNEPKVKKIFRFSIAILSCIFSLWAICSTGTKTVYYGFIFLIISVPLYCWLIRHKFKLKQIASKSNVN